MAKSWRLTVILTCIAILIKVFSLFPAAVEQYYSTGFFPVISSFQRLLTGFISFSIGDIIYAVFVIWIFVRLFKTLRAIILKTVTRRSFFRSLKRTINLTLIIYILFYGLWGLNYYRLGIASQLNLQRDQYKRNDLQRINLMLIEGLNNERRKINTMLEWPEVAKNAVSAYSLANQSLPFLKYRFPSVKSSFYGKALNYFGFLGYYNPFTGEANVNKAMPAFLLPFTTCHEIGHQLGYGTEDEANFAGYLSATSSKLPEFRYSARLELFLYCNAQLSIRDSLTFRNNYFLLDTLVKKDLEEYKTFLLAHKNPLEPFITAIYGRYLMANNQPNGISTYSDVVALLIAYEKKYGKI